MSGQLQDKVALITGGASGIGRAVAERFLAEGARVIVLDRTKIARRANVPGFLGVSGDARSISDNRRAVDIAVNRFGKLDIFVANAGIYDNRKPFVSY